jgi:Skp family chaperone for outer membrane proteins
MTDKTIGQVREEFGEQAAAILRDYHAALDAVREARTPEAGAYLDRLTDEQQMSLLREQKAAAAQEAREKALDAYRTATERYHKEIAARRAPLEERLFRVAGTPGEAILPVAATASEEQLAELLDTAILAGSYDQARAVFAVAHRRQLPEVMGAYFEKADPGAHELYREWQEIPPAEVLERQLEQAETIVHDVAPESLAAPPRVAS